MERLTRVFEENNQKYVCIDVCGEKCVEENEWCPKCEPFTNVMKKLAEYEDAEEQGKLIRLPCKVGDTVAIILMLPASGKFFINQAEVKEINIGKYHLRHDMQFKLEPIGKRDTSYKYSASDFGKYVFSSLAEAEQALAKMKEV